VVRVLSLFSGSLASRIATRLVECHPEVEGVCLLHLRSPFACLLEELRDLVKSEWPHATYRTQSLKREYRKLVGMTAGQPFRLERSCANCREILYSRAIHYMERIGAQYIVSGEIPWTDCDLALADDLANALGDRLLRPFYNGVPPRATKHLSAWCRQRPRALVADPEAVQARLERMAGQLGLDPRDPLAARYRCKLRRPGFGERVANLFSEAGFTLNALRLLDYPLYYKIHPDTKIVVAATEEEKRELQNLLLPQDLRVYPSTPHGPMMLVRTQWQDKSAIEQERLVELAARIVATHTVRQNGGPIPVYYRFERDDRASFVHAVPFKTVEDIRVLEEVAIAPSADAVVQQMLAAGSVV